MYLESSQPQRSATRPVLAWLFVALWMALIFVFSAQTGEQSGGLSHAIALEIQRLLGGTLDEPAVAALEGFIRSMAHGSVFFVLAILISRALTRSQLQDIRNIILTLIIGALYAGSDEFHQYFVPGRAMQLEDFLVDLSGIVAAIILYQVISILVYLRGRSNRRNIDPLFKV